MARKVKNIEKMPFLSRFLQKIKQNSFLTRKFAHISKRKFVTIFLFRKEFYLFFWKISLGKRLYFHISVDRPYKLFSSHKSQKRHQKPIKITR